MRIASLTNVAEVSYTYTTDVSGNITSITDNATPGYSRTSLVYDDLNRLIKADAGASLWGVTAGNTYAYDDMGNMTSLTLGSSGRTASYTYLQNGSGKNLPKLSSVNENPGGSRNVTYDSAGNETAVGATTYIYSSRNHLLDQPGLGYTYDGRGLRVKIPNGKNPAGPYDRRFFYSPEMHLLAEMDTGQAGPLFQSEYIWFAGHPVAQEDRQNQVTSWTFTDHLGTPILQMAATRTVQWRAEYEPFGTVYVLRGTDSHQPLRLPGQEAEQFNLGANGLTDRSYNIFRWYRPNFARYTQGDPLGVQESVYEYSGGNPVRFFDSLGLYKQGDVIYRCPPTGGLVCDVAFVWSDPTPELDDNGDETIVVFGPPGRCMAPGDCTGSPTITRRDSPVDPWQGFSTRGVYRPFFYRSEGIYKRRLQEWRHRGWNSVNPQCWSLANQLTGTPQTDWFRNDNDLSYWRKRAGDQPRRPSGGGW